MIWLRKCWKCGTPHKSPSGYCWQHAHLQDQRVTARPHNSIRYLGKDKHHSKPKYS